MHVPSCPDHVPYEVVASGAVVEKTEDASIIVKMKQVAAELELDKSQPMPKQVAEAIKVLGIDDELVPKILAEKVELVYKSIGGNDEK